MNLKFLFLISLACLFVPKLFSDAMCQESWKKLITKEEIQQRIEEVGQQITEDYKEMEDITVVVLLKGGIHIASDLVRFIERPLTLDFIKTKSYYKKERGELTILGLDELDFFGKNVLVVDDLFDSGKTLSTVIERIKEQKPNSISSVVAFSKKISHVTDYTPDYVLFEIENRFLVGYGMDYDQYYRNIPDVYYIP